MGTDTSRGACLCGRVQFEADLPSRFCAHCHCSTCRRAHGSAFVTWAGFAKEQVRVTAGDADLAKYDTETGATRSFCRNCGSTLFYTGPRWSDETHIARANLDDAFDRAPSANVYVDHKASWWEIRDDLRQLGGETGVEEKD